MDEPIRAVVDVSGGVEAIADGNGSPEPDKKKSRWNKKRIVLLVAAVAAVLISILILVVVSGSGQKTEWDTNNQSSSGLSDQSAKPTETVERQMLVINQKTASGSAEILSVCKKCGETKMGGITAFDNWLLYSIHIEGNWLVKAFDLETKQELTIFEPTFEFVAKNSITPSGIFDLRVIDGDLYFVVGGRLLWESLPPAGEAEVVAACGALKWWKDRWWSIDTVGDARGGFTSFSQVDLDLKKVTDSVNSYWGNTEGEEYVDMDIRERMIMAYHTNWIDEGREDEKAIYKYVVALPLDNLKAKIEVISKQNMPEGITNVRYDKTTDRLYLEGEINYYYSFKDKKISKTDILPKTISESWPDREIQDLEEQIRSIDLPEGYELTVIE